MMVTLFQLAVGIILLYAGAEVLVRGGASLALRGGLSPLVVGLTVIAFGTSSPELVVSLKAGWTGNSTIALGNVLGSNIANIGLVLGVSALIRPIRVERQAVRREAPILLVLSLLLFGLLWNDRLGRLEGALLLALLLIFVYCSVHLCRRENAASPVPIPAATHSAPTSFLMILLGLFALVPGSQIFVRGAVSLATHFGLTPFVIGLTVVAIGTSLPEIATSLVAAVKGEMELAVGNALGSNIFNILFILGASSLLFVIDGSQVHWIDWGIMLGFALAILPILRTGFVISRLEGAGLVLAYAAYVAQLFWRGG